MDQSNKPAILPRPISKPSLLGQIFKESQTRKSISRKSSSGSENVYENDGSQNYSDGNVAYEATSNNTFCSSPVSNGIADKSATCEGRIRSSRKHKKHDLDSFKKAIDDITKSVKKKSSPSQEKYTSGSEVKRYMALKGNKYDKKRTPDDIYQEVLHWPGVSPLDKSPTYSTTKQNGIPLSPQSAQKDNLYDAVTATQNSPASLKLKTDDYFSSSAKPVPNLTKFQKNVSRVGKSRKSEARSKSNIPLDEVKDFVTARGNKYDKKTNKDKYPENYVSGQHIQKNVSRVGKSRKTESSAMSSNLDNEVKRFMTARGNKYDKKTNGDIYQENYVSGQYINIVGQSKQKKLVQRPIDQPKVDIGTSKNKKTPLPVSEKPKPPERTLLQILFCRKPKKDK